MADNPLNQALSTLETTVATINQKVNANKNVAVAYKSKIIEKLEALNTQLTALKENNNLRSIPQLRQQLEQTQSNLITATRELEETKTNFATATRDLQQARTNIEELNKNIEGLTRQIAELQTSNQEKTDQIADLTQRVNQLTEDKTIAERNLASKQQEIDGYLQRIAMINGNLSTQIGLIDTIIGELGNLDNSEDQVVKGFEVVSSNIQGIINMINNPGTGGTETPNPSSTSYDIETNIANLRSLRSNPDKREYTQFIRSLKDGGVQNLINSNINTFDSGDQTSIRQILQDKKITVPSSRQTLGGKRRLRTMKKRNRRTRKLKKMRGGYLYPTSSKLDNDSSVITTSSGSKSKSRTSSKQKYRTHRKSIK